jgi:5-methylthioadenosine/S-adenosylhomocysteine deaminase
MRILIRDCAILPMTGKGDYLPQGDIAIEGSLIRGVAPTGELTKSGQLPADWHPERTIEARGKVALPGLVNVHTHAAMTLLRGYADDMALMPWLQEKIFPAEDRLTGEDVYWGTLLANLEMLKSGTTCFADMYFFMDEVAKAVDISGIRASLSRGLVGVGPNAEQALAEGAAFVRNWDGQAQGRITARLGPHAPYTCPVEYLKKVITRSDELGVGIHIHLAETRDEVKNIVNEHGLTPVQLMEQTGLFQRPVLAAHCVHLNDQDIKILNQRAVGVAHNPESNMKLASGVAPVPQMLQKGIAVGLGTDGAASNNNLDLLQEMRSAALLHKVFTNDPTVLPAYQALEMATWGGARALGLEQEIGRLIPGYKADLILIDLNKPHFCPRHDIVSHLVYSALASDVELVVVDGRIVVESKQVLTLNEKEIMACVEERAQRLVLDL